MAVETTKGLMVVGGCSHPIKKIILKTVSRFGKPYDIVGGLQGIHPKWLEELSLIVFTHCMEFKSEIKQLCLQA